MQAIDSGREQRIEGYRRKAEVLVLGALVAAVLYGLKSEAGWRGAVAALIAAAASFAVGVLIGFLFGIPKTRQVSAGDTTDEAAQVNTNLEQVSDWLTKILVGVGLTQLTELPSQVRSVADYVAQAMATGDGPAGATSAVVAAILVYFAIAGFLWGYLVTRLILQPELDRRVPRADAVARLASASPPDLIEEAVDEHDVAELLRFAPSQLKTEKQQLAWGRAKLERDPATARDVLENAVKLHPGERRAVEGLAFSALHARPPAGFARAIDVAKGFLDARGHQRSPEDANLYTYLACAYGQQYRWESGRGTAGDSLTAIRGQAFAAIKSAVELCPQRKLLLRELLDPAPGSTEDDLVVFKGDAGINSLLAT